MNVGYSSRDTHRFLAPTGSSVWGDLRRVPRLLKKEHFLFHAWQCCHHGNQKIIKKGAISLKAVKIVINYYQKCSLTCRLTTMQLRQYKISVGHLLLQGSLSEVKMWTCLSGLPCARTLYTLLCEELLNFFFYRHLSCLCCTFSAVNCVSCRFISLSFTMLTYAMYILLFCCLDKCYNVYCLLSCCFVVLISAVMYSLLSCCMLPWPLDVYSTGAFYLLYI